MAQKPIIPNVTVQMPPAQTPQIARKRDPSSEALLGVANGVVVGALGAPLGSAAWTVVKNGRESSFPLVFKNISDTHLGAIIGSALGLALINGLVRHAHAGTYNEWADQHNRQVQAASHTEKLESARSSPEVNGTGR